MKIYCDFDGVVTNSVKRIVDLYDEDYYDAEGYEKIPWYAVNSWDFHELKCTKKKVLMKYFSTERFFDERLELMPDCKEVIDKLIEEGDEFNFVTIGSKENILRKTIFLMKTFPQMRNIQITGLPEDSHDKSSVDMSCGVLIDDNSKNLKTSNALYKICFGMPTDWNNDWKDIRCSSWVEFYRMLHSIEAPSHTYR